MRGKLEIFGCIRHVLYHIEERNYAMRRWMFLEVMECSKVWQSDNADVTEFTITCLSVFTKD